MTKKNIMPAVVLTAICIVVAALLGVVNMFTAPVIEAAEEQRKFDSYRVVLDGTFEEIDKPANAPSTVTGLLKVTEEGGALKGHVVTLVTKGYAGDISITVGVDAEGKVTKAVITNQSETHGKAGMATYTDKFAGVNAETVADVETFSGATISSTAIKNAIVDAVNTVTGNVSEEPDEENLPSTDEEIKTLAAEMAGKELTLEELPLMDAPATLKRAYSAGDDGYFAYIVVPGAYVPVATEAIVHLNTDGEIVKVNLLQWVVGHDVGAGNFADGFVGADRDTIDDVELVTGATGTSSDFRNAVSEAVKYFVDNYKPTESLPTTDDEIKSIAAEMAGKALTLEELSLAHAPETLKRVYSAGADGYFLYIVVPGAYVPVATEAVVYLDTDFKIVKANLLQWVVGHGVGAGNFADGFVGTDKNTVGDVDLVTNATGTSSDFRTALEAALIFVADGEAAAENLFVKQLEAFLPTASGFESIAVPSDAPASLKKLYKTCGIEGYVAYIVTSTQYVAVETESLVYINSKYEVADIKLLTWTVGHGTEPGDFPDRLIGLSASELEDVELITGTTGTSEHLRDAVIGALKAVPKNYSPMIVGISVLSVALVAAVCAIIISKKRRAVKK